MSVVFHSVLLNEGIVLGQDCLFPCVYLLSTEDHVSIQFDALQHLHLRQNDNPGLNNVMRNNPSSFLRDEWPWGYSRFISNSSFSSYQNFLFFENQFSLTFCLSHWAYVRFCIGFACFFLLVSVFVRFNWFLFIYYPFWHCLLIPCVVHFMGNGSYFR